jgi:hypothetical protein
MYYQIKNKLTPCSAEEIVNAKPGGLPREAVRNGE